MRIHFVLPQLAPMYGMEKAALATIAALENAGCFVTSSVISGPVPDSLDPHRHVTLGVPRSALRLQRAVLPLRRHLSSLDPATSIVASGLWAAAPVAGALWATRRSYVAWEHSVLPARLKSDQRVARLFKVLSARALRPQAVIAVSAGVAQAVSNAWPSTPVDVVPNVVLTPRETPTLPMRPRNAVRLATLGSLRPQKNTQAALDALALLPEQFVLTVAGDGPDAPALRARAAELGLEARVRFLGQVADVQALLAETDVLVHPSLAETFGLSLLEAANAGVPVAAFPVQAIDEIVPLYAPGRLAPATGPVALAEAVRELAAAAPSTKEIRDAWVRRRIQLSPEAVAAKWQSALGGSVPTASAPRRHA